MGDAGVDHVSIDDFECRMSIELRKLPELLRDGTYRPQASRSPGRMRNGRASGLRSWDRSRLGFLRF